MNSVRIFIALGICLTCCILNAQTATEAFRFSMSEPTGTARNLGAGNSMFAIGPDFSAIGSNPSGLGGYGKSEFVFTTNLGLYNSTSAFTNDRFNESSNNYTGFTLPNIGFIIHNKPQNSRWVASNWSIGLNRVAEFRRDLDYAGSTLGSITDSWRENATATDPDDLNGFAEGLAYTAGAIYDFEN